MAEKHTILGGKVHVYKRENSSVWQCSSFLDGRNRRVSTKEDSLAKAKDFAEDWYLELRAKKTRGELISERTFAQTVERFVKEYEVITDGDRNEVYVRGHKARLRNHLVPYFGKMGLSQVTSGAVQDYRIFRLNDDPIYKPPATSTMHQEIVTLRQVLKTAVRHGWLHGLPDLSEPYRKVQKVSHRAWFSPEEYKQLYTATRANIKTAGNSYHRGLAEQLHDKILFMANTGIRPDEANWLEYRDIEIVEDDATGETILLTSRPIVGHAADRLFPVDHKKQFNRILEEQGLKTDRQGNRRTLYSLRHSYISFRLLEGADIYQIAKNCRTSVEMIEKHYAVHLKNSLDAAAINVRKPRKPKFEP